MPELGTSGSVGAAGGQLPAATQHSPPAPGKAGGLLGERLKGSTTPGAAQGGCTYVPGVS
jgi:hypothetical protein